MNIVMRSKIGEKSESGKDIWQFCCWKMDVSGGREEYFGCAFGTDYTFDEGLSHVMIKRDKISTGAFPNVFRVI